MKIKTIKNAKKDYLTTQNPLIALFIFFIPIALGNIFQQFYNLVDSAILGKFVSEQALAAAAACLSLTNVFIFIANGYGIGAGVIVGNYFGAKNFKKMKEVILTAFITSLAISIVLGFFGVIFGKLILALLKTPEDTIGLAVIYLQIYFFGLPFVFLYNITSAMFNALGESKYPLIFLITSSLLNIFLDLFFVIKLNSGIAGVAYATLIAQGCACIISLTVFFKKLKQLNIGETKYFDIFELNRITKIALPSILQQATISIGLMLIQSTVNSFGSQALAGYSVGMRIESLGSAAVIACGASLSTFTAQNLGAKKYKRINHGYISANVIVMFFSLLFFLAILAFKKPIIYFFIGQNCSETAFKTATEVLTYMSKVMVLLGFKHTADGILRGLGRMKMFTIGNLVNIFIRVSFSKIFAPIIGIQAIWISNPIGWCASLALCYISYRHAKRQMNF